MEQHERERLAEVMAMAAAGDGAGVAALYLEFGGRVRSVVRRQLRRFHVEWVRADDLDGLVLDACLAVADLAGGWDPDGGAAPWHWAERRIGNLVAGFVGVHADELAADHDIVAGPPRAGGHEPDPFDLLCALDVPGCALLVEAIETARLSERDRRLLLDAAVQAATGDPSPANTVGALYDLQPAAARQAVKRAKDRLRLLARSDERFGPLADLALLAA